MYFFQNKKEGKEQRCFAIAFVFANKIDVMYLSENSTWLALISFEVYWIWRSCNSLRKGHKDKSDQLLW